MAELFYKSKLSIFSEKYEQIENCIVSLNKHAVIMKDTSTFETAQFTATQTTPYIRTLGFIMGILHIPTLIVGGMATAYSAVTVILLPITLTIFVIGFICYLDYWKMYLDKMSWAKAENSWRKTFYFNLFLIIPAIGINIAMGFTGGWFIVGFILASIAIAQTALNEMTRH